MLQVLAIKKINANAAAATNDPMDRYRLTLSDGEHYYPTAMLVTQLNDLIVSGTLSKYSVIRLNNYTCNKVQDHKCVGTRAAARPRCGRTR